jgi:hypothetical protein
MKITVGCFVLMIRGGRQSSLCDSIRIRLRLVGRWSGLLYVWPQHIFAKRQTSTIRFENASANGKFVRENRLQRRLLKTCVSEIYWLYIDSFSMQ